MTVPDGQDDRPRSLEELAARLTVVERRLAALERGARAPGVSDEGAGTEATAPALSVEHLALVGRTLLVLAGAYAIRSFTESGLVPPLAGVGLGLLYALVGVVLSERAAGRTRVASAGFHALAASAIAYPLLWESAARFEVLSPAAAAAGIVVFAFASLAVAWRRSVPALVWIPTAGSIVAAAALAVSTKSLAPSAAVLAALAAGTLRGAYAKGWRGPAVLAAVAVDGTLVLMTLVLLFGRSPRVAEIVRPAALLGLLIAVAVLYLGSPLLRALRTRAETTRGEIALAVPAGLIGVGGALFGQRSAGLPGGWIGAAAGALAAGCYAVSFASLDRREGGRAGFVFYTSAGLALALVAFATLLSGSALAWACCAAAAAAAWIGWRRGRATSSLHAAVFLVAGAWSSGLVPLAARALAGAAAPAPREIAPAMMAVLAVAVVFAALPVASHGRTWGRLSRLPKVVVAALLVAGGCGIAVAAGSGLLPSDGNGAVSAAALAVLRTAALAVASVALALASRRAAVREAAWLVYPVLGAGGVKMLAEDVRVAGPAALVVSFALLGGALIVAPRLARGATPR